MSSFCSASSDANRRRPRADGGGFQRTNSQNFVLAEPRASSTSGTPRLLALKPRPKPCCRKPDIRYVQHTLSTAGLRPAPLSLAQPCSNTPSYSCPVSCHAISLSRTLRTCCYPPSIAAPSVGVLYIARHLNGPWPGHPLSLPPPRPLGLGEPPLGSLTPIFSNRKLSTPSRVTANWPVPNSGPREYTCGVLVLAA